LLVSDIVVVKLRYDGLDAEAHELDLSALGESLQGAAKVLGAAGTFATTGRLAIRRDAMDVRVVAREPQANCFSISAVLQFVQQQGLLQGGLTAIIAGVVSYVFAKASNNKDEMKLLSQSLEKAIEALSKGNSQTHDTLVSVVDRLADALRPAAKQVVAPIGRSCRQLTVGDDLVIDEATAAAIRGRDDDEVDAMREYLIQITELDLENRTAKVRLGDGSPGRIRAVISDPAIATLGNPYARAFSSQENIKVQAKAVLREGEIRSLFVSDTAA
jgi:predicted DNA-binding transcriptional regulator